MRKLLLSSTAIATIAGLSASIALADVSVTGYYEWKYNSRDSNITADDGDLFNNDSEIAFKFSNKTDNGLTVGLTTEMYSDGGDSTIDESSLTISGGFGKVVLGNNDGVTDTYGIEAEDLIKEEDAPAAASSTIAYDSDISLDQNDENKVSYHLPAMMDGKLTAGASYEDSGDTATTDISSFGAKYTTDMGGATLTLGVVSATQESTATNNADTKHKNMGAIVKSVHIV